MKFLRLRTSFLTFILGIVSVPFVHFEYKKWNEPLIEIPQVRSDSPIIIIFCPEPIPVTNDENVVANSLLINDRGGGSGPHKANLPTQCLNNQ